MHPNEYLRIEDAHLARMDEDTKKKKEEKRRQMDDSHVPRFNDRRMLSEFIFMYCTKFGLT